MKIESNAESSGCAEARVQAPVPPATQGSELQRLRAELRRQLALLRKPSLYSVLGVPADSSDAAIASAIERIRGFGSVLDAETCYAMEALGDAAVRESFDRRLLAQLKERKPALNEVFALQPSADSSWSASGKALTMLILVLGIGYLGLGYMREKSEREIRIKEVELREAEVRRSAEIAERVADNQQAAIELFAAAQAQAAEARQRGEIEARMREDKQRLDMAFRQEQQAQLTEQRRQQLEQNRQQMEARRRDVEAANATRLIRQQASQDAIARGNYNEAQRLRNMAY